MNTLKERLEAVWNNYDCLLPCNFIIWNESSNGYSRTSEEGLFYKKGKLGYSKRKKYTGKARRLFKNYGGYSQHRNKIK